MKTSGSFHIVILTILATLLLAGTTAMADLTDGLVGRWNFDEGFGSTAYDWVGDNDGTAYGAQWTIGQIDGALDFDGLNDRVEVPHSDSLNLTSELSISMWIKPHILPNAEKDMIYKAVDNRLNSTRTNYGFGTWDIGRLLFVFRNLADTTFPIYQTTDVVLSVDTWYHVCVVHRFGNGSDMKIYVNGIPQPASWIQGTGNEMPKTGNYPLEIGSMRRGGGTFGKFFDGKIDDICLYDRVLSDEEVQSLYSYRWTLEYITDELERALTQKAGALAALDAAMEKESSAYSALEEVLESGDYGDLQKTDIAKVKRGINSAMRQQGQAENVLNKSVAKLENSLILLGLQTTAHPDPNLVSHWRFDEGAGSTAHDSAGNNDGTLVGDISWTAGKVGDYAIDFDGDSDYVEIANDDSLNITNEITISAWVKPLAYHSSLNTIVQKWGALSNRRQYLLAIYNNKVRWYISTNGLNAPNLTGNSDIPLNQWSHIVGTYNGSTLKIYVNGSFDSHKAQFGSIFSSDISARIGGYGADSEWANNIYFNGSIDDVRIYNRTLPAVEVVLLYCNLLD